MFNFDLVDPKLIDQYQRGYASRRFDTSSVGIENLPEAVLYFLNGVATGTMKIEANRPATILDYGCGQSALAPCLQAVLSPVVEAVQNDNVHPTDIRALFRLAEKTLLSVVASHGGLLPPPKPTPASVIVTRYDPAFPACAKTPEGFFDYVVCLNVLEHLPDIKKFGPKKSTLRANINKIAMLSGCIYVDASCRRDLYSLPNGHNLHCTIKPPETWKNLLANGFLPPVSPVLDRDPTACAFVKGTVDEKTIEIAKGFIDTYGAVDLIPFRPDEAMNWRKLNGLNELRAHKLMVINDVAAYWEKQGAWANARPQFRRLTQALAAGC